MKNNIQDAVEEFKTDEDRYWLTCELDKVQSCAHWSYEHCDCDCHFNSKEKAREDTLKEVDKAFSVT